MSEKETAATRAAKAVFACGYWIEGDLRGALGSGSSKRLAEIGEAIVVRCAAQAAGVKVLEVLEAMVFQVGYGSAEQCRAMVLERLCLEAVEVEGATAH